MLLDKLLAVPLQQCLCQNAFEGAKIKCVLNPAQRIGALRTPALPMPRGFSHDYFGTQCQLAETRVDRLSSSMELYMKVHFVRHGESEYNVLGLCNADPAQPVPLTEEGEAQARRAGMQLQHIDVTCIYVSQLQRAVQTAHIINHYHGCPLRFDARLNDRRSGFEGRPIRDYLAATQEDPINFRGHGGESYRELMQRVGEFLGHLATQPIQCAIVVTHHEVLQVIAGHFRNLTPLEMWNTPIDNGAILSFEID